MNNLRRIWRTSEDHWIRVVGQQTTSAKGHIADHVRSLRHQGHMEQLENDKCQVEINISGTCKSQIRVTRGSCSARDTSSSDARVTSL
jgi:hypothetical protein